MDVSQELTGVRAELVRADQKAAALLGLAGTATSVAIAVAALGSARLPGAARFALWVGVVVLAAAVVVLLLAVRPALPRRGRGVGWVLHANVSPADVAEVPVADAERARVAELVYLSRLTRGKFGRIRAAVDLLLAALLVLLLTVGLAVLS